MKGSGKQILLEILRELSTRIHSKEMLRDATNRLRTGLLLHGSTAEESFEHSARLSWCSENDEDGVSRQGIAVGKEIFVSDMFESMIAMPGIKEYVLAKYPSLSAEDYDAGEWSLWLIISAVQMLSSLVTVEEEGDLEIDEWVSNIMRHYDTHFRDKDSG